MGIWLDKLSYRPIFVVMEQEIWKDIDFIDGIPAGMYQVSNMGRVRSNSFKMKGRLMSLSLNMKGYPIISLNLKDNTRKTISVHRLVAKAFIDNPDNKPQVNHINGIKTDNRVENLEWTTNRDNVLHSYSTGLNKITDSRRKKLSDFNIGKKLSDSTRKKMSVLRQGEKSNSAKLSNEDVLFIKVLIGLGIDNHTIGNQFNISHHLISKIRRGHNWTSVNLPD
jgi:hypothetical protein